MIECIFCEEQQTEANEIARDELFRARWDAFPVTPGHAEIVPLRHVQYFDELTEEELSNIMIFGRQVIEKIRLTDFSKLYSQMLQDSSETSRPFVVAALEKSQRIQHPPEAINLGLNDGLEAGQSVPHLHMHIMPRWQGDVENPRGGVRGIFKADTYKDLS